MRLSLCFSFYWGTCSLKDWSSEVLSPVLSFTVVGIEQISHDMDIFEQVI